MIRIRKEIIIPSSCLSVPNNEIAYYSNTVKVPEVGDLIYGEVLSTAQYEGIENRHGRVHQIHNGSKAIFVFGNRYSPNYYEAIVPEDYNGVVDLIALGGIVSKSISKNTNKKDPTKIKVLGYVFNKKGKQVNTKNYSLINPRLQQIKHPRSKCILVIGTAMNSGKSRAAVEICRILHLLDKRVAASKITGTARLKDILFMNDSGAYPVVDFSFMGYPSTYMLDQEELLDIFMKVDLKYANNPSKYWVVELADGILQRETSILLSSPYVKSRIHKLVLCSQDALGVIGGLEILNNEYNLVPHLLSGIFSSSKLYEKEVKRYSDIPILNSLDGDSNLIKRILGIRSKNQQLEETKLVSSKIA